MDLYEIREQIYSCNFRDEIGHPIENNLAFIALIDKVEELENEFKDEDDDE